MADKVTNLDREIEAMQKLTDLLSCYLCETILPKFRREKMSLYSRVLS
jgi:hypothetical protein